MNDTHGEQLDVEVQQVRNALNAYVDAHRHARVDVYRYSPVSIRVRVIDPDFEGLDRSSREPPIWNMLKDLPDDAFTSITMLLLLTPAEVDRSLANADFEDPLPSRL